MTGNVVVRHEKAGIANATARSEVGDIGPHMPEGGTGEHRWDKNTFEELDTWADRCGNHACCKATWHLPGVNQSRSPAARSGEEGHRLVGRVANEDSEPTQRTLALKLDLKKQPLIAPGRSKA